MKKQLSKQSTNSPVGGLRGLLALLLFLLWGLGGLYATVTVTPLSVDYANKKVTFCVAWNSAPYNNQAWVWIDYCPVNGTTPAISFSTATISAAVKTAGNGTVIYSSTNTRGFFINYANATNAGATVTATLSNASGKFNWCAYGSDMPPNATVNAGGGYTLRGTPPFIINSSQTVTSKTFGAGTCITSITDLTGRPDGFASPNPTLSSPNSPSRCNAGAVTLSVTRGGGTTTAMTYTWTIGGTNYTTTTNSYTTASLSASAAYTVKVKNANNCESNTASGNITVNFPGTNGQPYHTTCGCANGTTNCSGTCKTTGTYTTNDGACFGYCYKAYLQLRNQCGQVIDTQYALGYRSSCSSDQYCQYCESCETTCNKYNYIFSAVYGSSNPECYCSNTRCTGGWMTFDVRCFQLSSGQWVHEKYMSGVSHYCPYLSLCN
jgi:hypothetical protein